MEANFLLPAGEGSWAARLWWLLTLWPQETWWMSPPGWVLCPLPVMGCLLRPQVTGNKLCSELSPPHPTLAAHLLLHS